MHKNYLISLSRAFMRDMIDFQMKHANTYFVARTEVEFSQDFLNMMFSKLNY